MTDKQKLKIAMEALKSVAATHIPKANTKKFWSNKTVEDCITVLCEDTDICRVTLKDLGEL